MSVFAADLVVRKTLKGVTKTVTAKVAAFGESIKAERDAIKAELNADTAPQE